MVFDGSKESCPNYDSQNMLNTDYPNWVQRKTSSEAFFNILNFQKTCFNICGEKNYVENGECKSCPIDFYNPSDSTTINDDYINSSFSEMCHYKSTSPQENDIPVWFLRQKDGNLRHERIDSINWNTVETDELDTIQRFWSSEGNRITDEQLEELIGERIPGSMDYKLPDEFMTDGENDFIKLRRKINEGRGDVVRCDPTNFGGVGEDSECYDKATDTYPINTVGTYGPEQLVSEEVHDFWITEYGGLDDTDTDTDLSGLTDFSNLLSGLQYDSTFEECINDKLNTGDEDYDAQDRISKHTSIKEFSSKDIHYLKRKLRKIITMKTNQVNECMNLLNLGKSICATGVADKTLMIGSLIFKIIGNDKIDIMKADNDERYKLNKLIDELGPLIPQAIKNIIHISKEYESRVCNTPSNTTLLLERLYTDLYDKQTQVTLDISPYIDFDSLINTRDHWLFIKKITVLVIFAFLFMHATNLVVAFLSRGQSITKI